MAEFHYTPVPSKIKSYFDKIQTTGIPDKVNREYLKSIGFKSSNDAYIITILKKLGFLDSSSVPTDRWKNYRDKKQAPKIMAQAIREAYSSLFDLYSDAFRKDKEAIRNFFSSKTEVGEKTIEYMVSTFKNLCELADFEIVDVIPSYEKKVKTVGFPTVTTGIPSTKGLTININIQLQLPATNDASIYDKLFESLKKHILSQERE